MVTNEPDQVGEVWGCRLVTNKLQHVLIIHCVGVTDNSQSVVTNTVQDYIMYRYGNEYCHTLIQLEVVNYQGNNN